MESKRLILFFVFSFSLFLLLDAWQRDQHPAPAPVARKADSSVKADIAPPPVPSAPLAAPGTPPQPEAGAVVPKSDVVRVETDLLRAEISILGGDLRRLEFKKHPDRENSEKPFVLFETSPERTYVAQSGLIGGELPTHRTAYKVDAASYQLGANADTVEVTLHAPASGGAKVTKVYCFQRGSYVVDVTHRIENQGQAPLNPFGYFQLVRDGKPPVGDSKMLPTFTGVAMFTDKDKFQKATFEDVEKGKQSFPKTSNDGWIAMLQHYFFSAWLPQNGVQREFYTRPLQNNLYAAGVIVPVATIAPGASATLTVPLYAGPQEQDKLAKLAPGLDLTVDYGWLTILAVPLFSVLAWFYEWVGNWGVAIILLTVLIKLVFYPLSQAGYRSMAKMRVVAPKLQRLKEQYGSDRQRMQQAMMELYKTEKINPLGGCFPIMIQIPVFIALYWVILASVELRHAPFFGWIQDLSAPDTLFGVIPYLDVPLGLLPILMGATMIIQTKLNPEPPDPVQAKVMKIMPVAFSVFFFFFPAGLVLYWLTNNILSIGQQWMINKQLGVQN